MKVSWTERARADLAAIAITIAGERGRFVAEKWRNRIVASTGSLAKMPFIGGEVREVGREDIREVGVPPYRAILSATTIAKSSPLSIVDSCSPMKICSLDLPPPRPIVMRLSRRR